MIDRLRALANRPIRPEERIKAFVIAAVLVVVTLIGLLALERPSRPAGDAASTTPPRSVAARPPAPESHEHEAPSPEELRIGRRVARRFLRGYLAYSYGKGEAAAIDGASPNLRRELAAEPPRVPASTARLKPRVLTTQLEAEGDDNIEATAVVSDGKRTYSTVLELDRARPGWQVSSLGG